MHAGALMRGCVFGVALLDAEGTCYLVSIGCDGELLVFDVGNRKQLVRRCLERGWRVYATLGQLEQALERGLCFGASALLMSHIHCVPLGSDSAPYDGAAFRSSASARARRAP